MKLNQTKPNQYISKQQTETLGLDESQDQDIKIWMYIFLYKV